MTNPTDRTNEATSQTRRWWWDEVSGQATPMATDDSPEADGWQHEGTDANGTETWRSERGHLGLVVTAETAEQAEETAVAIWLAE